MGTFVLHEEIGDKAFKKAVSNYLKKHAFQNVNTEDFFSQKTSNYDLNNFSKVWLESSVLIRKKPIGYCLKQKRFRCCLKLIN
jgi:aminopeptidase N